MGEAQLAQRAKSDSDATEDSGWGSDNGSNIPNLCELVPKVRELFAVHNSDAVDTPENGEAAEMTIDDGRASEDIVCL